MNILLINPIRFKTPPVAPLGLEYIAGCLLKEGHNVEIVDLCFSGNIYKDLEMSLKRFGPDISTSFPKLKSNGLSVANRFGAMVPNGEINDS